MPKPIIKNAPEVRDLARSLRAKSMKLKDIIKQIEEQLGVTVSMSVICQLTKDIPCKNNRGRVPIFTREEALERKRAYGRAHYKRTRAIETPEEREERLEYQRFMYRVRKEAALENQEGEKA